ncbi:MAG: ferredoxin family protein [Verrucomicrobia bacterium]|nr:ferredoxin family protein [Verrucomicrobiota bacterium]
MSTLTEPTLRIVFFEGETASHWPGETLFETMSVLLGKGYALTRPQPGGRVSPHDRGETVWLGQFEGAVVPEPMDRADRARFLDVSGMPAEAVAEKVEARRGEAKAVEHGLWKPWFPVIDYDRCTNCMQCLSFCLFGVYGVDEQQKIQAQNLDQCKTNCPACSRVCPEAAIMFPKYKSGPINGDQVSDADLNREKMKIDISALLGGDVYDMLRTRSERAKSRFSKERDSDKALAERQKCLTKLAQLTADVPREVLMSLPSPEEIARKAEEARQRAARHLGQMPEA